MPRPYLVGWYYALKDLKRRWKIKPHRKIWLHMLRRKYYWRTPEERVQSMKHMLDELKKIPFQKYDVDDEPYDYDENCLNPPEDYIP